MQGIWVHGLWVLTVIMRMDNRLLNLLCLINETKGHSTIGSPDPSAASTCGSVLSHHELCLLKTCSQVKPCAMCPSVPCQSDFPHQNCYSAKREQRQQEPGSLVSPQLQTGSQGRHWGTRQRWKTQLCSKMLRITPKAVSRPLLLFLSRKRSGELKAVNHCPFQLLSQ